MGGWDGEVEIKELKKKNISSAYILFRLDTKTLIMQDTMRPKPLWNCIWIFLQLFHEIFPALFHYYERKSFDRKKISWNQRVIRIEMRLQNGYDPIVPRDFLQKRHLRQSHCKMSIPTFVQTVVLSLLTFVQSLIRLAQMLWYFGFILTFFPSKRLGVKEAFQKGF